MNRTPAVFSLAFALLSISWLACTHAFLPVFDGQQDYGLLVADSDWTWITLLGFLAAMAGLFAASGLYQALRARSRVLAFWGYLMLSIGLCMELSALSWDLFVWPALIERPGMMDYLRRGLFLATTQFQALLVVMLATLLVGSILLGISIWRSRAFPLWTALCLLSGIVLYAVGNLVHVTIASIGLGLYSAGFIGIAFAQWKSE
jgi:hypothetical protein